MKRCILCLAALALAACGASGPLYLPGHEKHKSSLFSKEQRKTGATPADAAPSPTPAPSSPADAPPPAPQWPAAPADGSAPKPDASPNPAPPANTDSTPPPQP